MPALIAMAEFVVPETGVAARIVLELKPRPVDNRAGSYAPDRAGGAGYGGFLVHGC